MTTIIWDEGVMYSDTRQTITTWDGKFLEYKRCEKIHRVNGKLYAVAGNLCGWDQFQKRFDGSWNWSWTKFPKACVIEWDGKTVNVWNFRQKNILGIYIRWWKETAVRTNQYVAGGSGDIYAIEAIQKGLTPVEAIHYASDRDQYTNDEVISVTI